MQEYKDLVLNTLETGNYKPNRTGVDTISNFGFQYTIDLNEGFPLLTTKDLSGFRWDSLIHELIWYLSGEEHIRTLQEHTSIWDAWADEDGRLDTAYGRFWRRYPLPDDDSRLEGESWADDAVEFYYEEEGHEYVDQLGYVIKQLQENPNSRRLVVNAWDPANATVSTLPPCHYSFVFNVQNGDTLNLHLTQRSGDIALGIPFNIAAYSILLKLVAQEVGMEAGQFSHSIVDAHIYCGDDERGEWYDDNIDELVMRLHTCETLDDYEEVADWIDSQNPADNEDNMDHVPNLLRQMSRETRDRPTLEISSDASINELEFSDIQLTDYNPHDSLSFGVAE